jgi:hypothetical protein
MANPRSALTLKAFLQPEVPIRLLLRRFSVGSFEFRLALDAVERPWYGYGIYHAAQLASRLGLSSIRVLEFGVAGGDGLVAMERIVPEVEKIFGVQIRIFGFDTGIGMPAHSDYRDLPYIWRKGHYRMDQDAVRGRLKRSTLVLGDVLEQVPRFLEETGSHDPIGFIAFDLDYYSSTASAFKIFEGPDSFYLPRVFCYFDDVIGSDEQLHCEDVGELLAIRDFNASQNQRHRIRPINGLASKRLLRSAWTPCMWAYHRFDHSRYADYIGGEPATSS